LYALSGTIKTPKGTGQWQRDDDAVIWLESKQKKAKSKNIKLVEIRDSQWQASSSQSSRRTPN